MPKLVICSSVTFYPELPEIKKQFEQLGLTVVLPTMAEALVSARAVQEKETILHAETVTPEVKRKFIEDYFEQIEKGDWVLAYNRTKHGVTGYIGPNVLMELTVGFYLKKKLFLWQQPSSEVHGFEEITAMSPQVLGESIKKIATSL